MMKGIFPLPIDYFPPLELAEKEAQAFQSWADVLLQETIDAYHRFQFETPEQRDQNWKPLKQRGDLIAYRKRRPDDGDANEFRYLCAGRVDGTLDEVMHGRYADTTDSFRRISAVYRADLVDCAVLHVVERQSPSNPFFFSGFKWMTVQSPGKGLVKNRDVCWYEQMGLTVDRSGKEIGYTIAESVDLPTCPPFNSSHCVRAKLSVCYLYKAHKGGGVKVFMRGRNNAGGRVMDWIADLKSAELWLRIDRAAACAHASLLTRLIEVSSSQTTGFQPDGRCEVCMDKSSGVLRVSKQCAACRRFSCSRCIVKKRVLAPSRSFTSMKKEMVCKRCLHTIQKVDVRALNSQAGRDSRFDQFLKHSVPVAPKRQTRSVEVNTKRPIPESAQSSSCPSDTSGVLVHSDRASLRSLGLHHFGEDGHLLSSLVSTSTSSFASEKSFASGSTDCVALNPQRESYRDNIAPSVDGEGTSQHSVGSNESSQSLMERMVQMNLMAERARQLVEENDRLAQLFMSV